MNTLNLNMESSSKLQWAQPKCVPPAKRKERSWFTSASRMGANEANPDAIDTEKVFQYPSTPRGPRTQTISAGSRIKVFGTDIGGSCEAKGVKNHVTRAIDINRQPSWTARAPRRSNSRSSSHSTPETTPSSPGLEKLEVGYDDDEERETNFDDDESASDAEKASVPVQCMWHKVQENQDW
eukprot:jgi/Mesen1/1565/ME000134S00687